MRTGRDLPVVLADPVDLARRRRIGERHDRVVANAALEDVPEHDDRPAGAGEGEAEAAAFAGVVLRHPRFGIGRAAVLRRREEQPRAVVFLAALLRRHAVALVEPGREHRAIGIEAERLEALAFVVRRDRPQLGKVCPPSVERV